MTEPTGFEQLFREQWGRVLAVLVGLLGDVDAAEEAAQDAFAVAAERPQRQRHLGLDGQGGVAAGEHQLEPLVGDVASHDVLLIGAVPGP